MRILHVITAFHLGGAEEVAVTLACRMQPQHNSIVAALFKTPAADEVGLGLLDRLKASRVQSLVLSGHRGHLSLALAGFRLAQLCKRLEPDMVHSHTDLPDLATSIARRIIPLRVARTVHNTVLWPTHRAIAKYVERGFFESDLNIAVSNPALSAFVSLRNAFGFRCTANNAVVIPNGIAAPNHSRSTARTLLGSIIEVDKVNLCFAGRLTDQKGFDILFDAVLQLPPSTRDLLVIHSFASGDTLADWVKKTSDHSLPIRFYRPRADLRHLLGAFDALIMPSRFEGLSLLALESFAAGTPVISADVDGLTETLPAGWPLKFPANNSSLLAELLRTAVHAKTALGSLRDLGQHHITRHFSINTVVERYSSCYAEHLSTPRTRSRIP